MLKDINLFCHTALMRWVDSATNARNDICIFLIVNWYDILSYGASKIIPPVPIIFLFDRRWLVPRSIH